MDIRNTNATVSGDKNMEKYRALLAQAKVEMDSDVFKEINKLLELGVPPAEIHSFLKEIVPHCGLLKRIKIKPQKTSADK